MADEVKTDTSPQTVVPPVETTHDVAKQTTKAIIKPILLLSILTSAIPEPYIDYIYFAWIGVVIACYDLRPPTRGGKFQPLLMFVYHALNFIACNPQIAVQGLESSAMFKSAVKTTATPNKDKTDG